MSASHHIQSYFTGKFIGETITWWFTLRHERLCLAWTEQGTWRETDLDSRKDGFTLALLKCLRDTQVAGLVHSQQVGKLFGDEKYNLYSGV